MTTDLTVIGWVIAFALALVFVAGCILWAGGIEAEPGPTEEEKRTGLG